MDSHNLRTAAEALARRIYASLPLHIRLAHLMERLASAQSDAFGNVIYAEFIRLGVLGMPTVNGQDPRVAFARYLDSPSLPELLPKNYGREFGARAFRALLRLFRGNAGMAEDTLERYMLRLLKREASGTPLLAGLRLENGLSAADTYVITAILNEGRNLREERQRVQQSEVSTTNEKEQVLDLEDPKALQDPANWIVLKKVYELWHTPKGEKVLRQAFPDAPEYLELMLKGFSDSAIIGDYRVGRPSMLPSLQEKPITPQNWEYRIMPRISQALRKILRDASPSRHRDL